MRPEFRSGAESLEDEAERRLVRAPTWGPAADARVARTTHRHLAASTERKRTPRCLSPSEVLWLVPGLPPWGWIYRPVSWQGAALVILAAAFCVQVFVAVGRHSHSISDTLYGIFPYIVPTLIVLNWVASKVSGASRSPGP